MFAAIVACLLASAATPLAAQMLHGRIVDDRTGGPVGMARVTALQGEAVVAGPLLTTEEGRFQLLLPRPGNYQLRVEQLGYPVHLTEVFGASSFERIDLEVRLTPEPIELAPLEVVARGYEAGRDAFARRQTLGEGVFLDPVSLALMRDERHVADATDFLKSVDGFVVGWRGAITPLRGWGCLVVFLDHLPYPIMYRGPDPPRLAYGGFLTLNQAVDTRTVRGIEAYRTIDEVPEELREGRSWGTIQRCSVIWVWTTAGW